MSVVPCLPAHLCVSPQRPVAGPPRERVTAAKATTVTTTTNAVDVAAAYAAVSSGAAGSPAASISAAADAASSAAAGGGSHAGVPIEGLTPTAMGMKMPRAIWKLP